MKKKKLLVLEAPYQELLHRYIDAVIAHKKREYESLLEPFSSYEKKVRHQLEEEFIEFHERFMKGYDVLIHQMKKKNGSQGPR
jgi:hypothetical protein